MTQELDIDHLYRKGVAALRAGDMATAKALLTQVVTLDETHEQAWLWLSGTVDDPEERIICLENVLTINPNNAAARRGLEKLRPGSPLLKSRETPPESEPSPTITEHGSPSAVSPELQAVLTGQAPTPPSPEKPEEGWRTTLYDAEHIVTDAVMTAPKPPKPNPSITDLVLVWIDLLILNFQGGFQDEVKYGGLAHTMLNFVAAGLLQFAGMAFLLIMIFVLPFRGFTPPLVTSTLNWFENQIGEMAGTSADIEDRDILELLQTFITEDSTNFRGDPLTAQDIEGFSTEMFDFLSVALFLMPVLTIPLLFIQYLFQAFVTNLISGMLNGKGTTFETLSGMSLALVSIQLVTLVVSLAIVFLPVQVALGPLLLVSLYELLVTVHAVGTVQQLGFLPSLGVMIMGSFAANFLAGLPFAAIALLLS